eukprot:3921130-Pyramimonas_sp.AAC.1
MVRVHFPPLSSQRSLLSRSRGGPARRNFKESEPAPGCLVAIEPRGPRFEALWPSGGPSSSPQHGRSSNNWCVWTPGE